MIRLLPLLLVSMIILPTGYSKNNVDDVSEKKLFDITQNDALKKKSLNNLYNEDAKHRMQVLEATGSFPPYPNYLGVRGKKIYGGSCQAYITKTILSAIEPHIDYETSALTLLKVPLDKQKDKIIKITKRAEFGDGQPSISVKTLQELEKSAKITLNPDILPKQAFLELQKLPIQHQDIRTLFEILQDSGKLSEWQDKAILLGFKDLEHFKQIASMPIMLISSNICHSQAVHFFVEEHIHISGGKKYSYNKMRDGALDDQQTSFVFSIPGINFAYSSLDAYELRNNGMAKLSMTNMWKNILSAAMSQKCEYLSIPPIGLGAFLPGNSAEAEKIAELYFETLFELLSDPKYAGSFKEIFYNTGKYNQSCKKVLAKYQDKISCSVQVHSKDAKFLAINLSKAGFPCGLINPSDMDVVLGKHDVGEYYKNGHYAMEEDIAATSTAFIGSAGISGVYKDESRILLAPVEPISK